MIGDFAYPLPVAVFNEMLGLPDEDAPQVRLWIAAVARILDPVISDAEHLRCMALMNEMYDYLDDQIEAKRRAPAADVLTAPGQAAEDGARPTPRPAPATPAFSVAFPRFRGCVSLPPARRILGQVRPCAGARR